MGSELEQAAEMMAQAYRLDPRPDAGHWYMVLPSWVPYARGLTWEQFCAEFDQSARRLMLPGLGCVGFEIYPAAGQIRRHRISWLDQPAPPEEDTDAIPA